MRQFELYVIIIPQPIAPKIFVNVHVYFASFYGPFEAALGGRIFPSSIGRDTWYSIHVTSMINGVNALWYLWANGFVVSSNHSTKKPVTTMLTYPWKCTVLHCNHLGNTWKPLVLMTRHSDYCPSASEGDNQSVRSSAPVVSRCFLGGYNVQLYISRGRLAWWLLAFLHSELRGHAHSTGANCW